MIKNTIFYIKQVLFCSWSRRPDNCSAIRKQPPSRRCWRAGGFLRAFRVCRRARGRCWRRRCTRSSMRRCWPCVRTRRRPSCFKRPLRPAGAGRAAADGARLYVLYGRERLAPDGAKAPERALCARCRDGAGRGVHGFGSAAARHAEEKNCCRRPLRSATAVPCRPRTPRMRCCAAAICVRRRWKGRASFRAAAAFWTFSPRVSAAGARGVLG